MLFDLILMGGTALVVVFTLAMINFFHGLKEQ